MMYDYPPIYEFEDIAYKQYLYCFIVQNTNAVKKHRQEILEFIEEKYANGMNCREEFGSKVSFTFILFDKKPSASVCHCINDFREAFIVRQRQNSLPEWKRSMHSWKNI